MKSIRKDLQVRTFDMQLKEQNSKSRLHTSFSGQIKTRFNSISTHKRRKTVEAIDTSCIQNHTKSTERIILPNFKNERRKSFIEVYQQNIVQKSIQRKLKDGLLVKSRQFLNYNVIMRKRLLKKARFRVQGLPSVIIHKKGQHSLQRSPERKCIVSRTFREILTKREPDSGKIQIQNNSFTNNKRNLTQQKFVLQPWQKYCDY